MGGELKPLSHPGFVPDTGAWTYLFIEKIRRSENSFEKFWL